jgi:hypothetical protein
MTASNESLIESAKAAQEIAKVAGNGIDAAREVGGFISRFVAGPIEQGMGIFEDRLRYMRWERQVRFMRRSEQVLRELGFVAPTRPVPLKVAIPLLQGASIEEDDHLQDRWVNLLINAANANSGIEIQRSYIEILGQITSLEAIILDVVYALPFESIQHDGVVTEDFPHSATVATKEDKSLPELSDDVKLAIGNLARVGCLKVGFTWGNGENFSRVNPTMLGQAFVRACRLQVA